MSAHHRKVSSACVIRVTCHTRTNSGLSGGRPRPALGAWREKKSLAPGVACGMVASESTTGVHEGMKTALGRNDAEQPSAVEADGRGCPASAPSSSAPAAVPARRNGKRDRTAYLRVASQRRRAAAALWQAYGVRPCARLLGGECPYHRPGGHCGDYARWVQHPGLRAYPCAEERKAVAFLGASLSANLGVPESVGLALASGLLVSGRDGDGRLRGDTLRQTAALTIESARARARAATVGKLEGLDGYMQLLAGAPGGAA